MRARSFNKRIEIWNTTTVSDGFGGNTVTDVLVTSSWANVNTINGKSSTLTTELGILEASSTIEVKMRKREDLTIDIDTMYVKYRSVKYVIKSNPTNVGFKDNIIQFIATRSD